MQTKIKKFGKEFGLILPLEFLNACGLGSEATITLSDKTIVVTPSSMNPRQGWAEANDGLSPQELASDFNSLSSFTELQEEWDEEGWDWPQDSGKEKV